MLLRKSFRILFAPFNTSINIFMEIQLFGELTDAMLYLPNLWSKQCLVFSLYFERFLVLLVSCHFYGLSHKLTSTNGT